MIQVRFGVVKNDSRFERLLNSGGEYSHGQVALRL